MISNIIMKKHLLMHVFMALQGRICVSALCSGTGFPVEWISATPGDKYWFLSAALRREYQNKYKFIDINNKEGTVYAVSPACESEYYDNSTGYHYYLMDYTAQNSYSDKIYEQRCHGLKQYGNIIREYFESQGERGVLSDASECASPLSVIEWSFALVQCQRIHYPFQFAMYNFTFSVGNNPDYCANKDSTAYIYGDTISMNSCYDRTLTDSEHPFNSQLSCVATWPAEDRDEPLYGDWLVVEVLGTPPWPYCGRYHVSSDGVIIMSLYMNRNNYWSPVYCEARVGYNYDRDDASFIFRRMIFTPIYKKPIATAQSTTTKYATNTQTTTTDSSKTTKTIMNEFTTTTQSAKTGSATTTQSTKTESATTTQSTKTGSATTTPSTKTGYGTTTQSTKAGSTTSTIKKSVTTPQLATGTPAGDDIPMFATSTVVANQISGNSTLSTSILSDIWNSIQNLDWPWWIAVGFIVAMLVLMVYCIKHACNAKRRQQSKVDNVYVKETKNVGQNKQKIKVGHNTVKDKVKLKKRGNLRHILVESVHQSQQRI